MRTLIVFACLASHLGAQAARDSAGIRIVEVDGSALNRPVSLKIATEPALLLGHDDSETEEFNQVVDVLRLGSGNVVVVNRGTNELRFFDPRGRYLRSSGRTGRGPGEYLSISAVALLPGDTLLVQDWSTSQINVVDSTAKHVRSFRLQPAPGRLRAALVGVFADGKLLGTGSDYPQDADPPPGQYTLWQTVFSFRSTGEPLKELSKVRERELVYFEAGREFNGSIRLMQPLGMIGIVGVSGNRYLTGDGNDFEVREYESDGTLVRILRVYLPRRRVTAADRTAEKERFEVAYKGTLLSSRLDELWPRAPMPEYLPAFQAFEVDATGRLWVKAYPAAASESAVWYLFDAERRPLGVVRLPARFDPKRIYADGVLGVLRDEDDVEQVVFYPFT